MLLYEKVAQHCFSNFDIDGTFWVCGKRDKAIRAPPLIAWLDLAYAGLWASFQRILDVRRPHEFGR